MKRRMDALKELILAAVALNKSSFTVPGRK